MEEHERQLEKRLAKLDTESEELNHRLRVLARLDVEVAQVLNKFRAGEFDELRLDEQSLAIESMTLLHKMLTQMNDTKIVHSP